MTTSSSAQGNWFHRLQALWEAIIAKRWLLPVLLGIGFILSFLIPRFNLVNPYVQLIMMYVGINIILSTSLNLVNGYMGEFSVGHAGFMAAGAYFAAMMTSRWLPPDLAPMLAFP